MFPDRCFQIDDQKGRESGLDRGKLSVEDKVTTEMRTSTLAAAIALGLALLAPLKAAAQGETPPPAKPSIDQTSKITIEVSGGDKSTPIENASVYIKYVEERKIKSNKTVELNVKTNREGTAHVPEAPTGRALIQVVADGWKTYGRWYDINEAKQVIKVHLDRPPKWY
jgi:hypothetical protein